jgi:hypothetical protein
LKDHERRIEESTFRFAGTALMGGGNRRARRRFRQAHILSRDEPHRNRRVGNRRISGGGRRLKDGGVSTHLLPWYWMAMVLKIQELLRMGGSGSERAGPWAAPRRTA